MRIIAVVITYRPANDCRELLGALTAQCDGTIVVDNGSGSEIVRTLTESCRASGSSLIALPANVGIAAAQNIGIEQAEKLGATHVLLSDHDSTLTRGMVDLLSEAISEDPTIAAVGPLVAEEREGADELVYMPRKWTPRRATKAELAQPRLDVAFIIASGCLINLRAFHEIGPMRDALFIDHVDLEWGVRARNAGYRLVAVPAARLVHTLGDVAVQLPGRPQPVHVHAPFRNYYIVRNSIWLVTRNGLMPWRWRVRYTYWVAKYVAFNGLIVHDHRSERRHMLWCGVRDGLRGRMGKLE